MKYRNLKIGDRLEINPKQTGITSANRDRLPDVPLDRPLRAKVYRRGDNEYDVHGHPSDFDAIYASRVAGLESVEYVVAEIVDIR